MKNNEKVKILVLDDEPIVGDRLKPYLEKKGYFVETYTRSHEAIDRLGKKTFHILVADLKMSGLKGIDVIKFAKERFPSIKSIVISGFATREMAEEALEAGAVEFIPKPFKMSQIRNIINHLAEEIRESL